MYPLFFVRILEAIMFENISRYIGLFVVSVALTACATTATKEETQTLVRDSETTLNNFRNDPEMKWFRDNIKKAKAVLVSPRIVQAGFVVGGSTGKAVAMSHTEGKSDWAGPAFYRVSTGSVGFQAGAQASETVILMMTEKAVNSLLSSSFKMGGDVSFAVGPVGAGAGSQVNADMVVFTRSKGLYGGLNLDGTAISVSEDDNAAYYGKPATPVDILVKHSVTNPNSASLQKSIATTTAP
jgi:SH3 domain-containing YSC84-like protein 1